MRNILFIIFIMFMAGCNIDQATIYNDGYNRGVAGIAPLHRSNLSEPDLKEFYHGYVDGQKELRRRLEQAGMSKEEHLIMIEPERNGK